MRLKMTNIMHAAYYVAKQVPFTHFPTLTGLINWTGGRLPGASSTKLAYAQKSCIIHFSRKRLDVQRLT